MAVYKGREVQLLGRTDGAETSPLYNIMQADGTRESVRFNQLQLTEQEMKDSKEGAQWHLEGAKVIPAKDLQELRDSQDRKKIEEKQKNQPRTEVTIPAQTIKLEDTPKVVEKTVPVTPTAVKAK
jgi:hypothetical protein